MYKAIALRKELSVARENLALILERKAEYVTETDVPLQLVKQERHLLKRIKWLERRIREAEPLALLRTATKLLAGPVAQALEGRPWKSLKQRLLTQASKLPTSRHLEIAMLETTADDLARLIREIQVLLEAHRIEPNPGQLEALERRAAQLGWHLMCIYQLLPGKEPELDALVSDAQCASEIGDTSGERMMARLQPSAETFDQRIRTLSIDPDKAEIVSGWTATGEPGHSAIEVCEGEPECQTKL